MFRRHVFRQILILLVFAMVLCFSHGWAHAQTWVPPKGRGLVILNYQYLDVSDHLFFDGSRRDLGEIQSHSVLFGLDLGLTNRLAVNGAVAFVSSRYLGDRPENSIDEGSFNSAFQNASVGARYMVLREPFVLTPFASFGFPTHNYQILGHAAVGRNLNAFTLGLGAGRDFDPFLPDGYFQATYAYSFVEGVGDFSLDTHDLYLELGYYAFSRLSLRGFGNYLATVDGVQWGVNAGQHFETHDQGAKTKSLFLGVGLGYGISHAIGTYASILTTVEGENTHDANAFNFGMNYYFSSPF